MSIFVRLWRGEWKKTVDQEWHFHPDEGDYGLMVKINEDETSESVEGMVRRCYSLRFTTPLVLSFRLPSWMLSPLGYKTPPTTITRTEDLCVLLNVRTSLSDLGLLVTIGPKRVAEYEFLCRSSFTIGTTTYVVDNTQTDEARADYERLVYGDREKETEKVMNALFSEQGLMLFHRVSCKMAYADQIAAKNNNKNQASREIIVLEDDDDLMYEANPVNFETGESSQATGGRKQQATNMLSLPITQGVAPPIFWDVGMDVVNYQDHRNPVCENAALENDMRFWEGVIAAGNNIDQQLQIVEAPEVEMENVGGVISLADENNNGPVATNQLVGVENKIGEGDGGGSSTGSTRNIGSLFENQGGNEVGMLCGLISAVPFEHGVVEQSREEGGAGVGMHTDGNVKETELFGLPHEQGTPSQPTPSLFKLTLGGPSAGPTGVVKADKCDNETSTEASDNDGEIGNYEEEVAVGMLFRSREAFRQHMYLYAISRKFWFKCAKSEPGLMSLECCSPTCPWRVYAVRLKDADVFEIRKVVPEHVCSIDERGGYETQATTAVIGELLRSKFGTSGSGPSPCEIRHMMRGDLNVNISYWKAWRSRDVAMDNTKESDVSGYAKLPDYLNKLVRSNPGTLVELFTKPHGEGSHRFKFLFIAFEASIKGYEFMRRVVVIDGTHLKGKFGGCLLTASAQDGNYQIFPLAFAIVDGENDISWEWFLIQLSKFVEKQDDLVFVSDRHPSIFKGISKVYPSAGHCICIVHLKRNIRSNFKGRHLEFLVAKAARCYRIEDFEATFKEIRGSDHKCAEYLMGIGLHHWARSHFQGKRYNMMTSNQAESSNGVLREARELPVIRLIEFIRSKLMTWFGSRAEAANKCKSNLTPKVLGIVTENFEKSGGYEVLQITEKEYEVREKEGGGFHVNLGSQTCSCFEFQTLAMPCSHAIAAALKAKVGVESLVAPAYFISELRAAYGGSVYPIDGFTGVGDLVANVNGLNIFPPSTRRPPGRPKKQRFFSRGEKLLKRMSRRTACSRCKKLGHNKATCKEPI